MLPWKPKWVLLYSLWKLNSKCFLLPNQNCFFIIDGGCWFFFSSAPNIAGSPLFFTLCHGKQIHSLKIRIGFPECSLSWPEPSMPPGLRSIKYWNVIAVGSKNNTYQLPCFILEGKRFSYMTYKMTRMYSSGYEKTEGQIRSLMEVDHHQPRFARIDSCAENVAPSSSAPRCFKHCTDHPWQLCWYGVFKASKHKL